MQNDLIDNTWRKPPLTAGAVLAVWLQNAGGGIGGAVAVGVVAWQVGADAATGLRWAAAVGGLLFAALMVLRSAIDEIVDWSDYRAMLADMDALEEANGNLEKRCAALQRDLHAAETYAPYQAARPGAVRTDRNGEPMPAAAPAPEVADAKTLIQRHFDDGKWPAKDRMNSLLGWSSTRWFAARDVLAAHQIIASQGRNTVVLVGSLAEALAALSGDKS